MTASPEVEAGRSGRRVELRAFLRSRREGLTPTDVGLPDTPRRRTAGLRREEVAVLAGVGVSWYTWLEQGRPIQTSSRVIDAVSDALRLTAAEREHLLRLAGHAPLAPELPPEPATPGLRHVLDHWMPYPAYALDRYWNIVASNEAFRVVFGYESAGENVLVASFTRSALRERISTDGADVRQLVANYRAVSAAFPEDRGFADIVSSLRSRSEEFDRLWRCQEVGRAPELTKVVRHPTVGVLRFVSTAVQLANNPEPRISLLAPEAGTPTESRLRDALVRAVAET